MSEPKNRLLGMMASGIVNVCENQDSCSDCFFYTKKFGGWCAFDDPPSEWDLDAIWDKE